MIRPAGFEGQGSFTSGVENSSFCGWGPQGCGGGKMGRRRQRTDLVKAGTTWF